MANGVAVAANPEEAYAVVLDVLLLCPLYNNREAFERLIPNRGVQMLVLYMLTNFDLIEHGGGIGGSWLTKKGEEVRDALTRERDADGFEALGENCCIHGYAVDRDELLQCPECGPMNTTGSAQPS